MAVYPKSKGKWLVRIFRKGIPKTWVVSGSKADAEAFEARQRVALEQGDPVLVRTVPTFSDFCVKQYKPHAQAHLRKSTWSVRRYHLATLIEHFGALKLTEITTGTVEAFKAYRRRQGQRPVSINNELAVLRAVRTYARKLGLPVSTAALDPLPVIGRGRVTFWNERQMETLLVSMEKHAPEILPLVLFVANTGCRKGEAIALEWSRVDTKRRIITIEPNEEWQPKDNEAREITISDALLPYLRRTDLSSPRWVFPSRYGGRYAYWPKRAFDRARKLAGHADDCALIAAEYEKDRRQKLGRKAKGAKPIRARCSCEAVGLRGGPHTLRHTFASHFLKNKPDIFLLSKILGHSETRTTKLYSHLLPDHLAASRNAVSFGLPLCAMETMVTGSSP